MRQKAAIALSVNFLVIIIIAIAILGLSTVLFSDVFFKVQEVDVELKQQYKEEIWRLLDTGGVVVAPLNTKEVPRGDSATFGVGVRNILETKKAFTVVIEPDNVGECESNVDWLRVSRSAFIGDQAKTIRSIEPNEREIVAIGVELPKGIKSCTYVFDVSVKVGNQDYGTMQKLYVVAQ